MANPDYSRFYNDGPDFSFIGDLMTRYWQTAVQKKEALIKERLQRAGLDITDDFVKENLQRVIFEDDPEFEHFYYRFGEPDSIRLISISGWKYDQPTGDDFVTKMTASFYYY